MLKLRKPNISKDTFEALQKRFNALWVLHESTVSSLTTYQKQDREHTEAIKTLYSERDANSRLTNELEELQDAVMALNPFINSVDFLVSENGFGEFECDACDAKALHIYKIEHTSDCPVAKLREVLKKQGVSDE